LSFCIYLCIVHLIQKLLVVAFFSCFCFHRALHDKAMLGITLCHPDSSSHHPLLLESPVFFPRYAGSPIHSVRWLFLHDALFLTFMSSLGKGVKFRDLSIIAWQCQSRCLVPHIRGFLGFLVLWMQHFGCPAIFQLLTRRFFQLVHHCIVGLIPHRLPDS